MWHGACLTVNLFIEDDLRNQPYRVGLHSVGCFDRLLLFVVT